jgi:hypothetical protein
MNCSNCGALLESANRPHQERDCLVLKLLYLSSIKGSKVMRDHTLRKLAKEYKE